MESYLPTGNEFLSLPKINELTAGIEDITYLSMQHKGMIEIRGGDEMPLIRPFLRVGGQRVPLTECHWHRDCYWIPVLTAKADSMAFTMTILLPVGERGFAIRMELNGNSSEEISWGLEGCWGSSWHCVNEDKPLDGTMHCYESGWNHSIVFDFRCGTPMFAFAPMADREIHSAFSQTEQSVTYTLTESFVLSAGTPHSTVFYWGLGFEEVAAATSAKEMLRRGWGWEYAKTSAWLEKRILQMASPKLTEIYNTNLFFCIFYSTGLTLDTEELVCATSRSTRYYVSAAYWDRDVLLWAFPAILDADFRLAEDILHYIFGRQRKNLGIHSRYIDGTVLEPGFELDELMAPVIALESYVTSTSDKTILQDSGVLSGIRQILGTLETMRHPEVSLYETFLQPTDDEIVHPYLTYNNMLVWRAMKALARLYPERYGALERQAENVRQAIYTHCVFRDENGKPYFGWSVDLNGQHNIYDEPPGSLQLLPYYGFCTPDDEIWVNTVSMIRSPAYIYSFADAPIAEIGCAHAPYPWILSLCNSLLCGHAAQAFWELEQIEMDNGIACESVDPIAGTCTTGAAFATCAGFLCHSMKETSKEAAYAK